MNWSKIKQQLVGMWVSWTIWFNTIGLAILAAAVSEPLLLSYMEDRGLIVVLILGNIILRFKTEEGLEEKFDDSNS